MPVMIILLIAAVAVLAASLARTARVKRDIRQMSRHLNTITHTDTNAKLSTDTFDRDASAMARSINQMLERNRLDHFEKIRGEADLKRAVTNISHDLRTPLTSALGYLQMLQASGLDEETRTRYLCVIKGRLDALSSLMNSLFEFAKIIEGDTPVDVSNVNAGNLLRDALSGAYSELTERGFTVDADIPDEPVTLFCDGDALKRILQNLFKNVCVHGKDYLRVSLSGGETDTDEASRSCVISISNKADGLAELEPGRMFDRFYTADAARTGKNTGLGLAIVKELASRMGAEISAVVVGEMLTVKIIIRDCNLSSYNAFHPKKI